MLGAFLALPLALVALALMVVVTALQVGQLTAMDAVAEAGLTLTLRTLEGPDGAPVPYVQVAQVARDSPAARAGLARGDVLLAVAGRRVGRPLEAWRAVEAAPGGREIHLPLVWLPPLERALGTLRVERGGSEPALVLVAPAPAAQAQGLRPGDVLRKAAGIPVTSPRQAWETVLLLARQGEAPLELEVLRAGETAHLAFDPCGRAELLVVRDAWRAWVRFLTRVGDPRYPEQAGLLPALVGSLGVVAVMAAVAFPLGLAAAVYLEEFARPGRFRTLLDILLASLAGLPSAVVGLLGLEVFARGLLLGRSILAGGFTLAVLILPIVAIAGREALRTVPRSLREAALSVGATPGQTVFHQVLPAALPGLLTGMVLALSRAVGEAAPLLLLGAFLYVNYVPQSLRDSFTVVPIQIFDWATRPQDGYATVTACAIVFLLGLTLALNGLAIFLRARFQRRWAE